MKRIGILLFVSLVFLVSAGWVQTVTGSAAAKDDVQNQDQQSGACKTGCLCSPPGLIGWWAGDGNARDIQGAGLPCLKSYHAPSNGILMNGTKFAWGFVGPAFSFDGIDDYVNVPDTPTLHRITTAVTVEAWINPQQLPPGHCCYAAVFSRRDPFVSEGFSIELGWDGTTKIETQTDSWAIVQTPDPVIQFNGKWQHVAATADTATGEVLLHLNGKAVALQEVVGGWLIVSGSFADVSHLFIGQREGSGTPGASPDRYKGLIDEVGLYNRALTPEEIRAIFLVGRGGRCKASF